MSDPILSAEEVDYHLNKSPRSWPSTARALADSHEALRARLAEVEAERDRKADYAERMDALAEERLTQWRTVEARRASAEARLAEAIELLRGTAYPAWGPDLARAVDRARAFLGDSPLADE